MRYRCIVLFLLRGKWMFKKWTKVLKHSRTSEEAAKRSCQLAGAVSPPFATPPRSGAHCPLPHPACPCRVPLPSEAAPGHQSLPLQWRLSPCSSAVTPHCLYSQFAPAVPVLPPCQGAPSRTPCATKTRLKAAQFT